MKKVYLVEWSASSTPEQKTREMFDGAEIERISAEHELTPLEYLLALYVSWNKGNKRDPRNVIGVYTAEIECLFGNQEMQTKIRWEE